MDLLELVKEGIYTVLGWTGQILEQTIDWGWVGPSEGICLITAAGILGAIIGKKLKK